MITGERKKKDDDKYEKYFHDLFDYRIFLKKSIPFFVTI